MDYNETGKLTVRTYTASGALPVPKSVIQITGVDENNRFVNYSLITDSDGVTVVSGLPAPEKDLSLRPGVGILPYSAYDVTATADGYYSKRIHNVAIFSGEDAVLPINMIPITGANGGQMYPRDTLDTDVIENALLE